MKRRSQAGFAVIELAILIVVLAVLGGTSYYIWQHNNKKSQPTASTSTAPVPQSSTAASVPSAPQVNNAADLNNVIQTLNQTDLTANNTDDAQLSTQSNGF